MTAMTDLRFDSSPTLRTINPRELWYAPDRRIRTRAAAETARSVVEHITTGRALSEPLDEHALFAALHCCAFRAARPDRGRRVPAAERRQWARRWLVIREYIVEQNLGLVYSMISRFNSRHLDDDDLLSDGMFALSRAVDRFNPWRGFRFSTYACNVVARSLMRRGKQTSNYRRLFPVQHDVELEQPSRPPDIQSELYLERLNRALDQNLGNLTRLESEILNQRFLAEDKPKLTFREIGDAIGLSKERVRQIQNVALEKLREVLDQDPVLQ